MGRLVRLVYIVALTALFVTVVGSSSASAQSGGAGSGGGGGGSGCSYDDFSTCYGAVWVYQTTNSDKVKIPGLYGADVYATGCKTSGGFFKYVLVNKQNDNDYRSWRIGPNGKNTQIL